MGAYTIARLLSEETQPQEVFFGSASLRQVQEEAFLSSAESLPGQAVILGSIRFGLEQEQRGDAAGEMPFSPQPQPERLCQEFPSQLVKIRLCQVEPWHAVQFCLVALGEGQPPEKVLF